MIPSMPPQKRTADVGNRGFVRARHNLDTVMEYSSIDVN